MVGTKIGTFLAELGEAVSLRLEEISALSKGEQAELAKLLSREADVCQDKSEKDWLRFRAGECLLRLGQKDQALAEFERIEECREWKNLGLILLEELARKENNYQEIAELYAKRASLCEPDTARALKILRARVLAFQVGDKKEAGKILEELGQEDPENLYALLTRAQIHLEEGDWKKLSEVYQRLVELAEVKKEKAITIAYIYRIAVLMEGRISAPLSALEWYQKLFKEPEAVYALPASIEILESLKQTKELKSAFSQLAGLVSESDSWLKSLLLFKLSQIQELEGEKEAELELLKKVVELDPQNLLALFRLEAIARSRKNLELLQSCLEKICEALEPGELKLAYLMELAQLNLDLLNQPDKCERALSEAEKISPESLALIRIRQSLCLRKRDWQGLISAVDRDIKLSEDPKELQASLILKADAQLYGLGNPAEALNSYRQALEIAPSQFTLLRNLEQTLLSIGDFEGYLRIALAMEKLISPAEDKAYYIIRRAFISELALGKPELAVSALSEFIRLKPDSLPAIYSLGKILREKRAGENYVKAMSRILSLAESAPEYAYLLYQAGWDFENFFNQPEVSAELWQKFQKLEMKSCTLANAQRRLFYRSRDWAKLSAIWQSFSEKARDPNLNSAFLLRTGFFFETFLGEPGEARARYEKALQQSSTPLVYPALIELACFNSDWESASALLKDFGRAFSKPLQAVYLWQASMIISEKLPEKRERILEDLKQAESLEPSVLIRESYLEFLRSQNNYTALEEKLEELISLLEETRVLPYQLELAWVLSRKNGEKDRAIEQYLKILSTNERYLPVIRELEFLALEENHPRLLVQALTRELPLRTQPELLVFIYHWLAEIFETEMKDDRRALSALQSLIKLKPDWVPALEELRRIYGKLGLWKELVKSISAEISLVGDLTQKLGLLKEQAEVYLQKLNDPDHALQSLSSAHSLSPKDRNIIYALENLYQQLGKWQEMAMLVEEKIQLAGSDEERAEFEKQAGTLYEEKLNDFSKAIEHYERAEKILPEDVPILRSLERLYPAVNRFRDMVRVLEKLMVLARTDPERVGLINQIGRIYFEKLNEMDSAIESFTRTLKIDAGDQTALESLVILFRQKKDSLNLVKHLERLAEVVKSKKPDSARDLYLEAGEIYDKELSDENSAINCWRKASALAPQDLRAVQAERKVYERRGDWKEVARVLEQEVKILASAEDKKETYARLGALWEQKLLDQEKASMFYKMSLDIDSEYLPALRPLAEIYYQKKNFASAEPLYKIWIRHLSEEPIQSQPRILYNFGVVEEKLGKIENAVEAYERACQMKAHYLEPLERLFEIYLSRNEKEKAENRGRELALTLKDTGDQDRLFSVLARMGVLENELGKPGVAIDFLEHALGIKPAHYPSLRLLVDLYRGEKNWTKTLSSYDRLIKSAGSPDLIAQGLLEKGDILEKELSQRESAIAHYRKAVEVKPDSLSGWRHLSEAYIKEKKWKDAAEAYLQIINLEPSADRKVEDYYNLGLIYRDGFGDLTRARDSFEKALSINKLHIPSMEAILTIYLKEKKWEKYIELSQRFISTIPKGEEKKIAPLHFQRGEVFRDFLENKEKAISEFQAALRVDSTFLPARVDLAELYAKNTETYPQALREHQNILDLKPFRIESYRQMGQIYEFLNRPDEAFCCYSVLELLRSTNRDEEMFLDAHLRSVNKTSSKTLAEENHYRLLPPAQTRGAFFEIIAELGDYLVEIFPPQLEKFGASKANKVPANSTAGIKKLTDELANNLGVSAYDLYLVPQQTEPRVAGTNPPSLILNAEWINKFKPEEQRFILGKWMLHLRLRHWLVFNNPLKDVFRAVMLFVWLVVPEAIIPGMSEDDMEREAKPIKRAVPRKVRSQLENKAKVLAQEGLPKDPELWKKGINLTGNRAGLLLANDLTASLSMILKLDPRLKQVNFSELQDRIPILEQSEEAMDLIRFFVSEAYFTLRKRAGFSLLSA